MCFIVSLEDSRTTFYHYVTQVAVIVLPDPATGLQVRLASQQETKLLFTKQEAADWAQLEGVGAGEGGEGEGALVHPSLLTSVHGQDPARSEIINNRASVTLLHNERRERHS